MQQEIFGKTEGGKTVSKYRLKNANGNELVVSDYGCTLMELWIKGNNGEKRNIVLGYPDFPGYVNNGDYLGACVGRFGGYIKNGRIAVNGQEYQLALTDTKHHLHGGMKGFDKYVWKADCKENKVIFSRRSPDGEEAYPGNLDVHITYELTDDDEIRLSYEAISDKDTVCNLTNHTYFNLDGAESKNILDHELQINAELIQNNNADGISDMGMFSADQTPFDFRTLKKIGKDIMEDDVQLSYGHGYDHNYYLGQAGQMKEAAVLYSEKSGIEMRIFTNQSGIQLYTGNYLSGGKVLNNPHGANAGVCLETQYCPSEKEQNKGILYPILKAGQRYIHQTVYKFAIKGRDE